MTVTVGVDSYVDEVKLQAYADARGIVITGDLSQLLIRAMDILEPMKWKGVKTLLSQDLEWPRSGVYVDGELIDASEVPQDIESAQMVQALTIDSGFDQNSLTGRAVKKEKLDTLEVEYADNASTRPINTWFNNLVSDYLRSGFGGGFNIPVVRA